MRTSLLVLFLASVGTAACGDDGSGDSGNNGGSDTGGSGGSMPDTTLRSYLADDPLIQYVGRVDFAYPKSPEYSSPAVTVRVRFKGISIAVGLSDGSPKNSYDAVLDGTVTKIVPVQGQERYVIAEGLEYGEHELSLVKRTEAAIGRTLFLGAEVEGELLEPPAPKPHKLEIIGDSISCGAGAEAMRSADCADSAWGTVNNARIAFGSLVAKNLDADYHVTAVSGIGLVRNYSDMYDARPMPEVYDSEFLQNMTSKPITPSDFPPDAILIVLGTNDFSPGDNPPDDPRAPMDVNEYADAYIAFVDTLLDDDHYPNAHIFALGSPMLTNGWPNATDTFRDDLEAALTLVEDHYVEAGSTQVHKFSIPKVPGVGCGTHPGVEEHADTAALVEPFVRETMGW
jgi:lysophospholipase L1-like esterase